MTSALAGATMPSADKEATIDSAEVVGAMWWSETPVTTSCLEDRGRTIWRGSERTAATIAHPADREGTSSTTATARTDTEVGQVPIRSGSSRRGWINET